MTPNPSSDREPNQSRQYGRRTALTTFAAAGVTSFSGCLDILSGDTTASPSDTGGDDNMDGTPAATATSGYSLPEYTKWAYPKGTRDASSTYTLRQFDPQAIINNDASLLDGVRDLMDRHMADLELFIGEVASPEDTESLVVVDGNRIYNGPWSAVEIEDSVSAFMEVEAAGELGEYKLYEDTDANEGIAVTDGQLVVGRFKDNEAPDMESGVKVVKTIINTRAADAPQYGDDNAGFEALLDGAEVGYYNQTIIETNPDQETAYDFRDLKGMLGSHLTLQLEGDGTAGAFRVLFGSAESASEQAVQDFAEQSTGVKNWTDKSVTQQTDRVFTITGTVPTE